MQHYRYDVQLAFDSGVSEHPQKQMKKLGYDVIKSEPVSIADCWWFRVKSRITDTPCYLTPMDNDFKFSDERK